MTDTPPAKIEPWIRRLALDTVDYIIRHLSVDRYDLTDHVALRLHFSIAAHAPKQLDAEKLEEWMKHALPKREPSVPVSKLKTWRNAASIPLTYSDAVAFDELIHQAAQPTEKEDD